MTHAANDRKCIPLKAGDLMPCRVSTIVTWTPRVYIASIGNLVNTVTHLGLLRCQQALLERVAEDGQFVEALDTAR